MLLVSAAIASALVVAGCGEKSSNSDVANPPPASSTEMTTTTQAAEQKPSGPAQKLDVSSPASGDLVFEPKNLTAKAGAVTIVYKNPSAVPHNAVIEGPDGQPIGNEMKPFTEGQGETTATLEAGTYKFICSVPGHEQGGMVGEIKVS